MKEENNEYKGMHFKSIVMDDRKVDGLLTKGDERIVLNGTFMLNKISGSWKFGDQIQFVIRGNDIKIEKRSNNIGVSKVEIDIPYDEGIKILRRFMEVNEVKTPDTKNKFNPFEWNKDLCENCGEHNYCPKCNKFTWSKGK